MQITGQFIKTIYRGNNGYTVAVFEIDNRLEEVITVTGYFTETEKDSAYNLYGDYVEHPRYGMQFAVEQIEKVPFTDESNLIRYLSGTQFKGIGPKYAEVLIETLGTDLLSRIRSNPDILDDVPKMNMKKKLAILAGLENDTDSSYFFLTNNHLSMKMIMKLENVYGPELMKKVMENPYQMIIDVDGIGFQTADKFAQSIGFPLDHPYRLQALVSNYLLQWCIQSGDSYIEYDRFCRQIEQVMDVDNYNLEELFEGLRTSRQVVFEEDRVYPVTQYDAEEYIARYLSMFPQEKFAEADHEEIVQGINEIEEEIGITYQDKQKEAIEAFFEEDLLILTGGPGTGKTTIVRGMVKLCRKLFPQYTITLCAPTGRASKRLAELTDCEARTVHSLLKWDKETGHFAKNEDDPVNIDLLIVDEFSMVDQWVFYNLLKAGRYFKKIILIGDAEQLPSVGIGSVLKDFLDSGLFRTVSLEKIYRQQEGSDIISLAYDIKNDQCHDVATENDIRFFECDPAHIRNLTLQVVEKALNSYGDLYDGFMNVQVLAPIYRGTNGIDAMNMALQAKFNPPAKEKRELDVGYRTYREGDKILQLKNQPEDEVYNGDIGILIEIIYAREDVNHQNRMIVDFDGIMVEYTAETFANITHAYCVSVHKAQGSEYPIVIMPMCHQYGIMLQKRLLYTAVTRANRSLILIGQKEAFLKGVANIDRQERRTTLRKRLLEYCG